MNQWFRVVLLSGLSLSLGACDLSGGGEKTRAVEVNPGRGIAVPPEITALAVTGQVTAVLSWFEGLDTTGTPLGSVTKDVPPSDQSVTFSVSIPDNIQQLTFKIVFQTSTSAVPPLFTSEIFELASASANWSRGTTTGVEFGENSSNSYVLTDSNNDSTSNIQDLSASPPVDPKLCKLANGGTTGSKLDGTCRLG